MAEDSKIEWTHHTFNPWRGCTKVSAGCANCYAETLSGRNPAVLGEWGPSGTRVVAAESQWKLPLKWNREAAAKGERHRVFCASLADVFEDWSGPMVDSQGRKLVSVGDGDGWLSADAVNLRAFPGFDPADDSFAITMSWVRARLFRLIEATPNLDWLLLTKRPENVLRMTHDAWCPPVPGHVSQNAGDGHAWAWPANVWIGTSVEDQRAADERIPHLLSVPARVRFLSCEPLLGVVDLRRYVRNTYTGWPRSKGVDWVIVGGESGAGARPMLPDWARSLRDQCQAAGVAFHFKQWGEYLHVHPREVVPGRRIRTVDATGADASFFTPGAYVLQQLGVKLAGRKLDGREWDEFPEAR